MIKLHHVTKWYGDIPALENINLSIKEGEIAGIIGKSGAGKSTLIRCINLLERPTSGQVFVAGQELTQLSSAALREARKSIGMIFQQFNLLSSKTVYDNILLPLLFQNSRGHKQKILALLELVGLSDKIKKYPAQLSGGQKQRVAIARALIMSPKILLCDEATSSLDPHNTDAILTLLKKINRELNLTLVLITHEMNVIKQACDTVIVLDKHKIIETGRVSEIFSHPQKKVTRAFVNSALKVELPSILREKIHSLPSENALPIWRIYFQGHTAAEPIITTLAREYQLDLNILQASLECIQHVTLGVMILAVDANTQKYQAALEYLIQKNITIEVIGYVAREAL